MAPSYATCGACGARFDGSKGHTCPKWNPSQADVTRWEGIMREVAPPAEAAADPEIQHTIACDNTDRELCDCADYPPEPSP
mgnify:CR=1 FL=1